MQAQISLAPRDQLLVISTMERMSYEVVGDQYEIQQPVVSTMSFAGPFEIVRSHPPPDRMSRWRYDVMDRHGKIKANISEASLC